MRTLTTTLLLFMSILLNAQVLLSAWEVSGLTGFGMSPFHSSYSSPGITSDSLRRGPGMGASGTAATHAWGGNQLTEQSDSAAVIAGDWIQFGICADSGYVLSLTEISAYNIRRSSTGSDSGQWQYKVGTGAWTNIGSAINWGSNTTATGNSHIAVTLSSISNLQRIPSDTQVFFRLLLWGASGASGTWYINNQSGYDLQIVGDTQISSLPVRWMYSRINTVNGDMYLEWATASEINNSHFDIEASGEDGVFYPIGSVAGAGNSTEIQKYAFRLPDVTESRWYRIRQTDFDGKFAFSPIISAEQSLSNTSLKYWPNPVMSELYLQRSDTENEISVGIYDTNGALKHSQILSSPMDRIDVQAWSDGWYFLQFTVAGKRPEILKFMVKKE